MFYSQNNIIRATLSRKPKTIAIRPSSRYNAPVQTKRKPPRPPLPAHSESTEDHLERIAELVEHKGYARVTDVADELGVAPSTVSNMVRRLAARGFLNYEKYRGFSLTAEGRAVAARIKTRHRRSRPCSGCWVWRRKPLSRKRRTSNTTSARKPSEWWRSS